MRRNRICVNLPVGTTIREVGGYLWTKIGENMWSDGTLPGINSDRAMDDMLADGDGHVEVVNLELVSEPIVAGDMEEGDYVLMKWGFWDEDPVTVQLFDPAASQWLWHVAGWSNNTDGNWTIVLDAPHSTLLMVGLAGRPDGDFDIHPIQLPVGPDTVFHYVEKVPRAEHFGDGWDWEYEVTFVDPPEVTS